jgi:hypothetical protein
MEQRGLLVVFPSDPRMLLHDFGRERDLRSEKPWRLWNMALAVWCSVCSIQAHECMHASSCVGANIRTAALV